MTIPRNSPPPPASRTAPAGALAGGATCAGALAANGDPDRLLDVGHDAAALVEEGLDHLVPATQVVDGEQPRWLGELVGAGCLLVHRPVALAREDALALGRAQEVHERLRLLRVLALGDHRDGVL